MTATVAHIPLGRLVMTAGVADLVRQHPALAQQIVDWLRRHRVNDCPNLDDHDRAANAWAIEAGERVLTSWTFGDGCLIEVWLITEWDRSQTTVLLPSEY